MSPTTAIQRAEQWRKENACGEAAKVAIALLNELQALQAKQEQELIALHAKLAGETLRADQGWQRYEAANEARNRAEEECARAWGIVTMNRAIPEGHVVVPKEPTKDMVWKAEEDTSHFRHGDPWYGTEPISESQVREVWAAMIAAAAPANKEN